MFSKKKILKINIKKKNYNSLKSYKQFNYKNVSENLNEKFINLLMKNGNKCKAYTILYNALRYVYTKNVYTLHKNTKNSTNQKNIVNVNNTNMKYLNYSIFLNIHKNFKTAYLIFRNFYNQNSYKNVLKKKNAHSEAEKLNMQKYHNFFKNFKQEISNFSYKNEKLNYKHLVFKKAFYFNNTKKRLIFSKNLLHVAITNVKPSVETKFVRVSGKKYQVPKIISKNRQNTLAITWIIDAAKKRKKNSNVDFYECLGLELLEALNKHGKVFQKRNDLHKLAESNRAYMRFKWW